MSFGLGLGFPRNRPFAGGPSLNFQFAGSTTLDPLITFSRGTNATLFNSSGTLVWAPNNAIRNNTMVGAVAGTPGTLPTNWSVFTSLTGLTREIVGTGIENGITYIDIKISGTPSGVGSYNFYTETSTAVAALNGQTWTNSIYFKLQAGSFTGITSLRLYFQENNSGGGYITEQNIAITSPTSAPLNTQRAAAARTLNQAATAFLSPGFNLLLTGAAIDITLRIGMPQLERGSVATAVNATSGTAYFGPRFDYDPATLAARGLLIEEQRTNSIRNNTMQGAVAGTPGTLPTNWQTFTSLTGLTREIVGTGAENGITYIEIRISGTPSAAGAYNIFQEAITTTAAVSGQTWAFTHYSKLSAGSTTGISSLQSVVIEYSAASAFLTQGVTSFTPTTAAINTQRYGHTRTLTNASTAFARPAIQINLDGAAIDITLRIGLPQLEQGAFATSVIPTTTTALTRNADVASVNTLTPWYNATEGTLYAEYAIAGFSSSMFPTSAALSDNTSNNRININSTNTGANLYGYAEVNSGGVQQAGFYGATGSTFGTGVTRKSAIAYAVNDFAFTTQGLAVQTDTSGTVPTVNRLYLGVGPTGTSQSQNGYLRRVTYYPRRLSNAELQAITA